MNRVRHWGDGMSASLNLCIEELRRPVADLCWELFGIGSIQWIASVHHSHALGSHEVLAAHPYEVRAAG